MTFKTLLELILISIIIAVIFWAIAVFPKYEATIDSLNLEGRIRDSESSPIREIEEKKETESSDGLQLTTDRGAFKIASWYDYDLEGYPNYSKSHLTCASRDYEKGTILKITNPQNKKWIKCRVNDYIEHPDRDLDLSSYAFEHLAPLSLGLLEITIEKLDK